MLKINNLYKSYGSFNAVAGLNLHVPKGEIFGFVGPNGAGKTTTMKIICGLMSASSGEVFVDDIDVLHNLKKVKSRIGYMPDFFGVYDDLKVSEYLDFYASIYEDDGIGRKKVCEDLLELVNLVDKREAYVDSLSRGMKQRLCLARSLVHNPDLLVLDEPASGMDPRARIEMKDILRTLKDMGKTIIISSHILPELAELCTSIGIIEGGKILVSGTVETIMDTIYGKKKIKLKVSDRVQQTITFLKEMAKVDKVWSNENVIEFTFLGDEEDMATLLAALVKNDFPVVAFSQLDGNLEDIFMKVTGGHEA